VGADRRGPLAAFVILAIIAAVLLVTSVRSQAAPGWLDSDKLPATVIAAPVTEPHLWGSVAGGVHQVVQDGAVLVRRAATGSSDDQDSTTVAVGASTSVVTTPVTGDVGDSATPQVAGIHRHLVTTHPYRPVTARHYPGPAHDNASEPPAEAPSVPTTPGPDPAAIPNTHDHGRHLGWYHGNGHDNDADGPNGHEHGHAQDESS
jgi:hypothetical protein